MPAARSFARKHRATLSLLVVALAAATLVVYAVTRPGYTVRHVDLNDGGIWVTTNSDGLFGRLNKPIGQLDAGFYPPGGAQAAYTIDIVQDGSTVLAWDKGSGKLYPVDVRSGVPNASSGAAVAGDDRVELAGGTAAVLDPATGKLWAARMVDGDTSTIANLDSGTGKVLLKAGAGSDLAVGQDGTVYVASAATSTLYTLRPTPGGFAKPTSQKLDRKSQAVHVTAVGTQPVVLSVDTGTVLLPGHPDIVLPRDDAGTDAVLQEPGPDAPNVLLATSAKWISVPLDGKTAPTTLFAGGGGTPARPVRLGSCAHAAWGGTPGVYARTCSGGPVSSQKIPGNHKISQPVFRVNHDQLVLNDLADGGVWIVDDTVREVDNWSSVRPPKPQPKNDKPTKPQKDVHPPAQARPPEVKPVHLGARPGRTTVLHLLDTAVDPTGGILTITALTELSDPSSRVSISADGQTAQIALSASARNDVHFRYQVTNNQGMSASSDVTITPRLPGQNDPPHLRTGYQPKTWSVAAGGTFTYPVLADWRDYDGDPLALVGVSAQSGAVTTTDDGSVVFTAPLTSGNATVQIDYQVSDGIAPPVSGTLAVTVVGANSTTAVPATAEPDVARAIVNQPVTIHPLANDIPGSDPTDPGARLAIAAPVAQPVGAIVTTDQTDGTVTVTAKHPGIVLLKYQAAFGSAKLSTGVIRVDAVAAPAHPLPPVAAPDTAVLRGQEASIVDVLANDYDPSGDVLVVQRAVPAEANSGLQVAVIQGRWLRISSDTAAGSGVRIVNYTITDGVTDPVTGQVAVVQLPPPDHLQPPIAVDDAATVRAGDYVDVPVLDNDIDPNGQALRLKAVKTGKLGEGMLKVTPALGNAYISGNIVRYEAPAVTEPTDVLVDYVVEDDSGLSAVGHVRITINPPPASPAQDQPPNPLAIQRTVVAGDTLTITVPSTNVDPDGDSVSLVGLASAPMLGRVTAIGPTTITYQSYPLAYGTDTFSYTVTDRYGLTGTAQVRIGVVPPGDPQPPVAVDDHVTAAPGAVVHVPVLANDYIAPDDTVTIQPLDTTNDGVPPGTRLDGDRIVVTAPPATGKPLVVSYAIVGGTGARSVAQLIVDSQPGYDIPPEARDDVAKVAPGAKTTTVDALANDDDPDGNSSDLRITHVFTPGATVDGGKITIPVQPYAQAVGYQVTDKGGAAALAIIHVPGSGGDRPGLRPNVSPIQMAANSSKTVNIADYVVDPNHKQLRLTTTDRIWASPAGELSVANKGDTALTLTSRGGYVGPAAVIFEVTNGALSDPAAQKAIVSVPVEIGNAQPVLRCPAAPLTAVQGGNPLNVDILSVCHVWLENSADLGKVDFATAWSKSPGGVTLAKAGNAKLMITPTAQAHAGTSGTITVSVPGTTAKGTLNVQVIAAPPPTVAPITVRGLKAGQSQTVDVRQYVQTPIAGASISVVSTNPPSIQGVSISASGSRLTLTAAPGNTHGTMTFSFIVTDVTGPGHDDRHVAGALTVEVLGLPGTPGQPAVLQTLSHTAVVGFATPPANGAPIDQIQVVDDSGGTHDCPASPCTVNGLANGKPVRFQVRAHNIVGWSQPSPWSAATTPDALPTAVVGVAATPGDTTAHVTWTPRTVDGTPVTLYQVQVSPAPDTGSGIIATAGTAADATGLTNGVTYSFKVRAQNRKGWGPWSTPASAIPFGTPVAPAAPTAVGASPTQPSSNDPIAVLWNPPSDNGNGRPIVSYTVTPYKNGAAQAPVTVGNATSWTTTVSNDGSKWQFSVTATNSGGKTSPSSSRSSAITAASRPDPVQSVSAKATGNTGQIQVTFTLGQPHSAAMDHVNYSVSNGASGTWQVSGAAGTTITQTINGLPDGSDASGPSYTVTLSECNDQPSIPCSSGVTSNSVHPWGPPDPPTSAGGSAPQYSQTITWTWGGGDGNGRNWHYETNVDGAGWVNRGGGTSYSANYGWNTNHAIQVRVVNDQGTASAIKSGSGSVGGPKPQPPPKTASVFHGPSAQGQPGCGSSDCAYVGVSVGGFVGSGTVSGTYQAEQHPWSGGPRPFSVNVDSNGNGTWTSGDSYFGYPGVVFDIVIGGVTYKSTWQ